jgi:D-3-phosphoglycerate dehydrogenase
MKILIADKMDKIAADIFKARGHDVTEKPGLKPDELASVIGDYDGLAVRSSTKITSDILAKPGALRVIGRAGIGVDTIDVPTATRAGIVVMNTPFGNSVTTAEHTIAMLLSLARQIPMANASTQAGKWEKSTFMGVEVMGKTLGIIGCGNIGGIVAARALGLKMKILGYDPYLTPERALDLGITPASLDDIYANADFITIHTPMTEATRGLVNAAAFSKMKKGVRIINCARGGLVVEADLKTALDTGIVAGAALDVFETEPAHENILFGYPNVICTPHLGASTLEAQENVARQIAEQMCDFLETGAVQNAVNMPSISADDAPRLKPFMDLATALGAFAAQITDTPPKTIALTYHGHLAGMNTKPITACALAAFLRNRSDTVNMVNAPDIARAQGLVVESTTRDDGTVFDAALTLTLTRQGDNHTITGTVLAGAPRIVNIDGVDIEATVAPHMLFIRNRDQPGMIGALGFTLAENAVNIGDFRLGRVGPGGQAIALVTVDTKPSASVFETLAQIPHIQSIKMITF